VLTLTSPAHRLVGAVIAVVLGVAGALGASIDPSRAQVVAAAAAPDDDHINYVLAISIDGLNPQAIRDLGPEGAPNLYRLMTEGTSTLNARTALESTSTLPNHTGMLTARRVDARRGGHGVDFNDDESKTTVHRAAGRYIASVFDVVHDRSRATALYTSKDKFALYNRSWSRRHGAVDTIGVNDGRDKIDIFSYLEDEDALIEQVLADLGDGAAPFTFLHLSSTDKVGHASGYMGPDYVNQVAVVDARVGRLLDLVEATPELQEHLAVILTSDHGGLGRSHSAAGDAVNYTIPFMVWGSGVIAGGDLYATNPAYADPGTTRPNYAADPQPIRNGTMGNLATDLLDLPRIPGSQMNSERNLLVFAE
jgi:hypothetical protein